ncbi:hypothetical protein EVAR_164_1 [Eumeta japonica]|uniref:Uncharacterized protein n=1 Tax=Eumeta variegata TaxID=151549 RepID=A0A4C1S9P5_EUMVA|nr:hypothetical protein EVAR_164_1 [Eumeta japonica]
MGSRSAPVRSPRPPARCITLRRHVNKLIAVSSLTRRLLVLTRRSHLLRKLGPATCSSVVGNSLLLTVGFSFELSRLGGDIAKRGTVMGPLRSVRYLSILWNQYSIIWIEIRRGEADSRVSGGLHAACECMLQASVFLTFSAIEYVDGRRRDRHSPAQPPRPDDVSAQRQAAARGSRATCITARERPCINNRCTFTPPVRALAQTNDLRSCR